MCGACPGGGIVSATTAELNRRGLKRQALAELRRRLASGATLTLVGDGWSLRQRTGRQHVVADIEPLLSTLDGLADWTDRQSPSEVVTALLT